MGMMAETLAGVHTQKNVLVNNKKNIKKARNSITLSVLKIDTG